MLHCCTSDLKRRFLWTRDSGGSDGRLVSLFSAARLAALPDHFAEIADTRQGWKVMYPLREVLFLVVCGTIASGEDYDDIVDWGKAHLAFLRAFRAPIGCAAL
jgi:hypothetical protein